MIYQCVIFPTRQKDFPRLKYVEFMCDTLPQAKEKMTVELASFGVPKDQIDFSDYESETQVHEPSAIGALLGKIQLRRSHREKTDIALNSIRMDGDRILRTYLAAQKDMNTEACQMAIDMLKGVVAQMEISKRTNTNPAPDLITIPSAYEEGGK